MPFNTLFPPGYIPIGILLEAQALGQIPANVDFSTFNAWAGQAISINDLWAAGIDTTKISVGSMWDGLKPFLAFVATAGAATLITTVAKDYQQGTGAAAQIPNGGSSMSVAYPVYRLILQTTPTRIDTGATYPGCTRNTSTLCMPVQFGSVGAAFQYAYAHGELPYIVASADEAFNFAEAEERARQLNAQYAGPAASPLPPGVVLPPAEGGVSDLFSNPTLIIGVVLVWLMFRK